MPWKFYCKTAHRPLNYCIFKKAVDEKGDVECNFSGSCGQQRDEKAMNWLKSVGEWK